MFVRTESIVYRVNLFSNDNIITCIQGSSIMAQGHGIHVRSCTTNVCKLDTCAGTIMDGGNMRLGCHVRANSTTIKLSKSRYGLY